MQNHSEEESTERETPAPQVSRKCPIVGLGASAGGFEALKTFFSEVKNNSGLAYVVVQHLDPNHRSLLAELLGRTTELPVSTIEDGTHVEPDRVYVIPANAILTIEDGCLRLCTPVTRHGSRTEIDNFFISLAEERTENAACVILSGTGSDGTLGLRAIKHHGGLALAQAGAIYDGMMLSAVSTGLVDFVLPAEEMPAKLADYFHHPSEMDGELAPETQDSFAEICGLLRERTGHDFTGYRDTTVLRRMQRRMQILKADDATTYLDHLRKEPREIDRMFQDLLIGVTNFFRDPEVFEAFEKEIVPQILAGKGPNDTIRIWVPGCATGEEAYSIAILLREHMPMPHAAPKLQIFASDIDEHALEVARIGRFPATIAKDVPAHILARYFLSEDGTYRIVSDIRETCLFSAHNVLRDPPFTKLDLISCRNLLIYFTSELQKRLIPLFHYALRDSGYLLLGCSENVTRHSLLFSVAHKDSRIFKRREQTSGHVPEFPLTAAAASKPRPSISAPAMSEAGSLRERAEQVILGRYTPAYVVINADGDVLYTSAGTGRYLELPAGPPSNNVFDMARNGLRLDLRVAVHKSIETGRPWVQRDVGLTTNGGHQTLDLIVEPIHRDTAGDALCMIVFQDIGRIEASQAPGQDGSEIDDENMTIDRLKTELCATRERLQATTDALESSIEELKSSNEEISAINEELQSSNEELETSKEELQSVNEEMQTVNAELKARVEELGYSNRDTVKHLESTRIANIFLDRQLRIKSFTPAAIEVFHLVESDTGRPISCIGSRLRLDTIEEDAAHVLRTLQSVEEQVESKDGTGRFIMRILPSSTVENLIDGVVLTFIDVTRITTAEAEIFLLTRQLRDQLEEVEHILDCVPAGVLVKTNDDTQRIRINRYASRLLGDDDNGFGPRELKVSYQLFVDGRELPFWAQPLHQSALTGRAVQAVAARLARRDGTSVQVMIQAEPIFDKAARLRGAIAAIVDISEQPNIGRESQGSAEVEPPSSDE